MKGKRTGIDFSKHEVHVTECEGLLIHYIKKPSTVNDSIKYINTNGIMAVTGDYGNWIFCREFHPSGEGGVSDSYWNEKLQIASTQNGEEYDPVETERRLREALKVDLEEYGWEGKRLEEMKEYIEECLGVVDEEHEYIHKAYYELPSFADYEAVIFCKKYKYWLLAVFDGYDEICRRIKENEFVNDKQSIYK